MSDHVHKPVDLRDIHQRWTGPARTMPTGGRPARSMLRATEDIEALITEIEYLRDKLSDLGEWPECAECGCSDSSACLGGCSWVLPVADGEPLLCSTCVDRGVS